MPFQLLFPGAETQPITRQPGLKVLDSPPVRSKKKGPKGRGCEHCTLNNVPGLVKIFGEIEGKEILVFAQSPGPEENAKANRLTRKGVWRKKGCELIGKSGAWFWKELNRVGITREDCDVNKATRCFPADADEGTYNDYLKMRNPSTSEVKCCSLHTERMLEKVTAKQILVLGVLAAKQLLQTRSLPKNKIFWSEKLKAKVYLLDHPSFFIRGYASDERLQTFRELLDMVAQDRKRSGKSLSDRYAYVKKQDYRLVLNKEQALQAKKELLSYAKKGIRIAQDIEDDEWVPAGAPEDYKPTRQITACGFCPKPGVSYVFVFKHKDVPQQDGDDVFGVAQGIVTDERFHFSYQYGCSDVTKWERYEGVNPVNFDHDTMFGEFLRFSDRKSYGLDAIAEARFQKFSGYKTIIADDMLQGVEVPNSIAIAPPEVRTKYIEDKKLFSINKLSLETLRLYNGADAHLTKSIEVSNKKHVPQALMKLYIDLSFILADMEPNGPLFDFSQQRKLDKIYPPQERRFRRKLCSLVGKKDFNPGSHQQIFWAIYKKFKLEFPGGRGKRGKAAKPNTRKPTLLLLAKEHDFPRVLLQWRPVQRMKSTLKGYKKCAIMRKGRLRTRWNVTGARTGRISSGASRSKEAGLVNLQNIKKDAQVKNLCVADKDWRRFYNAAITELNRFRYRPLKAFWHELRQWELLPPEERKDTPKPKVGTGVQQCLVAYAEALEAWVRKYAPALRTFLCNDYGQLEVRVMAEICGDKNLKHDCEESDIHTRVGVTMTGWDAERIRKDEATRTLTKNCHFGIMFGLDEEGLYSFVVAMSPPDMAGRITREQVAEAYRNYFKRYKGVLKYHVKQRAFAKEHKCVYTLFGMRQGLRITDDSDDTEQIEIDDDIEKVRTSYWGNQAINGPVQGTAHQLLACALVNLRRKKKKYAMLGIPPMEVHDMLANNVRVLDLLEAQKLSQYLLEKESIKTAKEDFGINWSVPIVVEAKAGLRLGCQVELEGVKSIGDFLAKWVYRNWTQVLALNKELRKVAA